MSSQPAGPARVAFVCAMPMELRPLARRLRLRRSHVAAIPVRTGTAGGRPVLAAATGVGTTLAADRTGRLLAAAEVGHVIVFGIAGAIEGSTPIGSVIRPRAVIDAATGTSHEPVSLGPATPRGILWTSDDFITDAGVLAGLRARGVVALDMETAAIAAACERRGVRWSVVRAVSDRATDEIVTEEVFRLSKPDGTPDGAAVARYLARHPGHLPRMARLAVAARKATRSAADAAADLLAELG